MESKSRDPRSYMGVYKHIEDVPERRRLHQHSDAFEGRDVFQEFLDERLFESITSKNARRGVRRAERRWKAHMDERGRHHALATPDDVETWFENLFDRLAITTLYKSHYRTLEGFFSWLQGHTEYPHIYHPVWMAAADPDAEATARLWDFKMKRTRRKTRSR